MGNVYLHFQLKFRLNFVLTNCVKRKVAIGVGFSFFFFSYTRLTAFASCRQVSLELGDRKNCHLSKFARRFSASTSCTYRTSNDI